MRKITILTVIGALTAALTGCAATGSSPMVTDTAGTCAGVRVVVEFTTLEAETIDKCIATNKSVTALDTLKTAGLEITGSQEAGDNWICRVDGRPAADEELSTDTQGPFVEDCSAYGSGWAFWSLYVDSGSDWVAANEGVATQKVKPGQAVAVVWQLTDDAADLDAWQKPSV